MSNRLAGETSPYLLQHAENPVEWHPWGPDAFARARAENKPVLLSIGYSACHWCHVMAHESFEDAQTAARMNALFVNIKVDREERPDIDQIYQAAYALLTRRSGGWPLTMFLTPEQRPFFGGTYFPKDSRYGLPAFGELLTRVEAAYREQPDAVREQGEHLADALARADPETGPVAETALEQAGEAAFQSLVRNFDRVHGGFGAAPKFPHVAELELCLRRSVRENDPEARGMAALSLRRMAEGGIHDQLGGGFCRYSVDAEWRIPHFEKMLYGNALLLAIYSDGWRATRDPLFETAARALVAWLLREMRTAQGGFCSSLDADSEHEEGKFYVWTREEVRESLDADEYAIAARHWGLDGAPNFEHKAWNLRVVVPLDRVAASCGISGDRAQALLASAKAKLLERRAHRVRPGRDDKVLTSWNALMIAALARAARVFDEPEWLEAAQRAADFLRSTLWRDGKLLATFKDGRAHLDAYLDDHAFLLAALAELMQTRFRSEDLEWAQALADRLLDKFEDRRRGGFYFTAHDHEPLIHRPKPGHDNATPSGNGVAAQTLANLGHWLGAPRYLEAAERTVTAFGGALSSAPAGFSSLLVALEDLARPPVTVILRGDAARCAIWQRELESVYQPTLRTLDLSRASNLPDVLDKPRGVAGDVAIAWVCRGTECLPPIDSLDALKLAVSGSVLSCKL